MPRKNEKQKKENRDCWIPKTRVTQSELLLITERAKKNGLSVSELIRGSSIDGMIIKREPLADVQLIRQIAAIGNNLNQATRSINIGNGYNPIIVEKLNNALNNVNAFLSEITK